MKSRRILVFMLAVSVFLACNVKDSAENREADAFKVTQYTVAYEQPKTGIATGFFETSATSNPPITVDPKYKHVLSLKRSFSVFPRKVSVCVSSMHEARFVCRTLS